MNDITEIQKKISQINTEVVHSDASDNQKDTILSYSGDLSFMVGIVLGIKYRYEQMLKLQDLPDSPEGAFISGSCKGEVCSVCGKPAEKKLGEEIPSDDPDQNRHNLTAYVCYGHFKMIVG
jgi:hypothetical protein